MMESPLRETVTMVFAAGAAQPLTGFTRSHADGEFYFEAPTKTVTRPASEFQSHLLQHAILPIGSGPWVGQHSSSIPDLTTTFNLPLRSAAMVSYSSGESIPNPNHLAVGDTSMLIIVPWPLRLPPYRSNDRTGEKVVASSIPSSQCER